MRLLAIALIALSFGIVEKAEAQRCKDPRLCGNRGGGNGGVIRDRRDLNRPRPDRNRDARRDVRNPRRDRRPDDHRDVRPVPRRDRDRDVRPVPRYDRDRDIRPVPHRRRDVVRDRRDLGWRRDRARRLHTRYRHRPLWHTPSYTYRRYVHRSHRYDRRAYNRYWSFSDYYRTIPYRNIYWNTWVRYRVSYNNGFHWYNGYPYFVYNGYLHRYSTQDSCNYELVDGFNNSTVRTYGTYYSCQSAYDQCALDRDNYNYSSNDYRYFCSERLDRDYSYDVNYDYDTDFYGDLYHDDYYNN